MSFTKADIQAHQVKHYGGVQCTCSRLAGSSHVATCPLSVLSGEGAQIGKTQICAPKSRMNKTEAEYARILENAKRLGEIIEYRFEGLSLVWGADPVTGKPMHYRPDFYVVRCDRATGETPWVVPITIIEIKGGHIFSRDMVRFKGCRAEWPMFRFEMWQKKAGVWRRIQ